MLSGPGRLRMVSAACLAGVGVALLGAGVGGGEVGKESDPTATEFFESRVRPLLVDRCLKCHGTDKQSAGLRLDSREAILSGGDTGPAIVPGKSSESLLIQAVAHTHAEIKMPPKGRLNQTEIANLRRWVDLGAPWGHGVTSGKPVARSAAHWAFQPPRALAPPTVRDPRWARTPIDAFVLARLEAAGLTPSPQADRRTLIRRASIDLLGLPPTAEEIEAFEADPAADAYERLIDRLLASPHYGERWGRHWLDVARYADTKGYVFTQDRRYPYAYTYRDYIVSAFNRDVSYQQMILDQLAADREQPADSPALAAMGFLTVGRRFLLDQNEIIDDRIDVVSRGLLGLTVTCARCHDHKFDPIPSEDYYSLYGVFASSTEPGELPLIRDAHGMNPARGDYDRKRAQAIAEREGYLRDRMAEVTADYRSRGSHYLAAAWSCGLNPRDGALDARARAAGLDVRRLRTFTGLWRRKLESASADDPILGPWRAFAEVPAKDFHTKSATLTAVLREKGKGKDGKPRVHPLVARFVLEKPPGGMEDVAAAYVKLLAQLEQQTGPASKGGKRAEIAAAEKAEWDALADALHGPSGVLAIGDDQLRHVLDQSQRQHYERLNAKITELDATHPGAPPRAMVMYDLPLPVEPHVFIRGNPGRPGKAVPRRFLKVLSGPDRPVFKTGSGRDDLAKAIADPQNPLTARVFVNRVWMWHFGKGLVATPSDFGLRGEPPTHPELLDYLAVEFVRSGWSIKNLHRAIMLSSVYRQASEPRSAELERDPENRLLWRFNRQRMDFETMRDSILAVSGGLDAQLYGPTTAILAPPFAPRRTLYGFIDRQNLDGLYRAFDFAIPDATSPRRFVTTVPQQALFLMNGPFVLGESERLAHAIPPGSSVEQGVRAVYRRVLGRTPDAEELALGRRFIESSRGDRQLQGEAGGWRLLAQTLLLTNEFIFID